MKITNNKSRKIIHQTPSKSRIEEHHFISESLFEKIQKKAFELYEGRGCLPNGDAADWLEAEKIVLAEEK